jgi:hypothetical protein
MRPPLLLLALLLTGCEGRCPFRPDPVGLPPPPTAVDPVPAPPAPSVAPAPSPAAPPPKPVLAPAAPRVEPAPPAPVPMSAGARAGLVLAGLGLLAALVALYRRLR